MLCEIIQTLHYKCPQLGPKEAFYLKPLRAPTNDTCWYSSQPMGHCTLTGTVARLCKAAGITVYRTNHSLRATTATRLYQAGVDEQLIMERTGHHSVDAVRSYKRTSAEQLENILALSKKPRCDYSQPCSSRSVTAATPVEESTRTQNTHQQLAFHPDNLHHMFTFNSCSDVNINVHIQ